MQIIVKKFGGTSLADLSKINRAISYIKKSMDEGYKVVVVVSAMGKETNRLLSLEEKLDEYVKSDDISALLSAGEQISSSFFSIILNNRGIKGKSFQGWQLPITTGNAITNSHIQDITTDKIRKCFKLNEIGTSGTLSITSFTEIKTV